MDDHDKVLVDKILKHVLVGKSVVGMYFRTAHLWFASVDDDVMRGLEVFVTIENRWAYLTDQSRIAGQNVCFYSHRDWKRLAGVALDLAPFRVSRASVDMHSSHLTIGFDNKSSLIIHGDDQRFESWSISAGDFDIIAMPGTDLSLGMPDDFGAA